MRGWMASGRNVLAAWVVMAPVALQAQSTDSVTERRRSVESGLLPQVVAEGEQGFLVAERMAEHRVPGLSVAVINDGEVEWAAGYGVKGLDGAEPVGESTLFQAASISKSLTAAAALVQVDDGVLELDRDVSEYLRSWALPEGAQTSDRRVTLRALLSHTAGVNVRGFGGVPKGSRLATTVEVLEGGAGTPEVRVTSTPGEGFRYSGGGYQLVQLILEDAAGEPFTALVTRTVLDPLQMDRSTFEQPLPRELEADVAIGHQRSAERLVDTVPGGWNEHPALAAAGLWTTPTDLARFALGLRAAWLGQGGAILDSESVGAMLTPTAGPWGLGVPVSGTGDGLSFGHGGNSPGYASFYVLYPATGDGVVVMANATAAGPLMMEVVRAVERVYGWPGDFAPRETLSLFGWLWRVVLWSGPLVLAVAVAWRWRAQRPLRFR